jgi:hypothetical protein
MTVNELILLDKNKVRRDSSLMSLYLRYFQEAYNYKPNCTACSFATDWQKLVSFYSNKEVKGLNSQKKTMNISIKKIQGKILSYKKDGKTFRLYDNILTPNFIEEYLKNGSDDVLEERKKLFNLPDNKIPFELSEVKESDTVFALQKNHKKRNKK